MKRKDTTPTMEATRAIKLSDHQLLAKARSLSARLTERKAKRKELNGLTKRLKNDVGVLDAQIEQLREEIEGGFELRPQGDLFAQDLAPATETGGPPKDKAAQVLGKIAEKAEAEKPKPSEPHAFEPDLAARASVLGGVEVRPCKVCGAGEVDPVHHGGEQGALRHVYAPADGTSGPCLFESCGAFAGNEVHDVAGSSVATAPAAAPAEPTPCRACKRGTCEVHAHAFEGDGMRCKRCEKVANAKIHKEPEGGFPALEPEAAAAEAPAETSIAPIESASAPGLEGASVLEPSTSGNGKGGGNGKAKGHASAKRSKPKGVLARKGGSRAWGAARR